MRYLFRRELAGRSDGSFPSDSETGELLAFVIYGYGITVDMEKVSGHGSGLPNCGAANSHPDITVPKQIVSEDAVG